MASWLLKSSSPPWIDSWFPGFLLKQKAAGLSTGGSHAALFI
jgi:hypothetical protein